MTSESLKVESLRKKMPGFDLEADFEVGANERIAIVARSGLGKSTLLRLIAGLEQPDAGRVLLGGKDFTRMPVHERGIGFVFQDRALFSGRSVAENIGFGLQMRKAGTEERKRRVRDWVAKIGLAGREADSIDALSGGERQRIALARALITGPRLILLDEPFAGLDARLRRELRDGILQLHAENPAPLLFVSHDEADCEVLATARLEIRDRESVRSFVRPV